jgi:SNF2 family DNA or RNA helicase
MTDTLNEAIAPMVLRMDAESNLDMPELVVNDMYCELPPKCMAGYRQLKRELLAQLETGDILAVNAASAYIKMRQYANGAVYDADRNVHFVHSAKVDMLCDLIEELAGKPVLVFYQFQHDMAAIKEKFPGAPVLSGATPPQAVEEMLRQWNAGSLHVLLAQNQTASHGLNMQGSGTDIVYFGLGDSLEVYDQSYRRIYRQGVKGSQVRIHRLLTRKTVDDIILKRLQSKDQSQRAFFESLRSHAEAKL